MKEKLRSEIEEKYKWDLTKIYENDEEWEKDYKEVSNSLRTIEKYKGKILESANTLFEMVTTYFNVARKVEKVYIYAHLNYDAETGNTKYQNYDGMVKNLYRDFGVISSYIEPELLESDYSKIEEYYKEVPALLDYKNFFIEIFRYKDHVLSEKEETIISKLSNVLSNAEDTYEKLTDTDLSLGEIKDEEGNIVKLNDSNYGKYISSKDRRLRFDAFTNMYKGYSSVKNTIASTMYGAVNSNVVIANLKNYDSAIKASLYADNVTTDIYDNLIKTVNNNLDTLFKYYSLRKDVLGLTELHLYDLYANLIESAEKKYTFEEAKDIVLNALKPLGENYVKDATKAFTERWVDVYPNETKRSGAYSGGCYDTYPYMLLNYQGRLNDVSTLAHELGHSMHSYYSRKNNSYQDADYKIFVAEVASTVNELLLCKYLLKESQDKEVKLSILNRLMELFKGTIYRQTMFAEFEKDMYEIVEQGNIFTWEDLSNMYYDLNKKYFGNDVVVDEDIKYEWSRIPHFYYNFYVYKYATGLSAACFIVDNILSGKENALESYLEFLSAGSKYYPLEELKIAGVDMTDPKVVESAIKMFDEAINEFNELYNS
ncbi:MAG: oligoendopeptidase F [Bacilli bacterium]|nr:oligoendopeptidase F [Bacilli bacterium]